MESSAPYWKPRLESVAPSTSSCGHSSQQQGVTEPIRPEGSYSLCGQRSAQVQQSSPAVSKHMCAPRQSTKRILYEEQSQPCFQAVRSVVLEFGARSTFSPLTDRLSHTDGPSAPHGIHRNKPRCQQPVYQDDIDNQCLEATLATAVVAPVVFQEARPAWRVHIPPAAPSAIPKPTQALHAHVKSSNRHVTSTPATDGTFRRQSKILGCKRQRQQAVTVDLDDRNATTVWHYGAPNPRQRNLDGLKEPQRRVGGLERDGAILPDLRLTEEAAEGEIHSVRLPNVHNKPIHTFPQVGFPQAVPPATCPMGPSWLHANRDSAGAEPGGGLIAALSSSFLNSSNAHRERVMYLEIPAFERQRLPTPSGLQKGEVRLVRQVEEARHRTPPDAGNERVHETWQEEQQEEQEQWQGWAECWPAPRGQTCEHQSTSVAGPNNQRSNKSASDNHSVTTLAWSDCGVGCSGGTMQRASSPPPAHGSAPDRSQQPSESPGDLGSLEAGIDVSCPIEALAVILGVRPSNESHRAAGREALHEALILLTTRYYAEKGLMTQ